MFSFDPDGKRLGLETEAFAHFAGGRALILAEFVTDDLASCIPQAAFETWNHALERGAEFGEIVVAIVFVRPADLLVTRTMEEHLAHRLRQSPPGRLERFSEMHGNRLLRAPVIGVSASVPGNDRTLLEAEILIGNDEVGIENQAGADAAAGRAGSERIVERKEPGFDLLDREARHGAGEPRRERRLLTVVGILDDEQTVTEAERRFDRVRQPLFKTVPLDHAVDHDLDCVFPFLVEGRSVLDHVDLAIDPDALKSGPEKIAEFLAVLALATAARPGRGA